MKNMPGQTKQNGLAEQTGLAGQTGPADLAGQATGEQADLAKLTGSAGQATGGQAGSANLAGQADSAKLTGSAKLATGGQAAGVQATGPIPSAGPSAGPSMPLKTRILVHAREFYRALVSWVPAAPGTLLRMLAYKPLFKNSSTFRFGVGVFILGFGNISLGRGVALNRYSSLTSDRGSITLGNRVYVGDFSIISGDDGEVIIGNNVLIASHCLIQAANHRFDRLDIPIMDQGHSPGKVIIEDNVWIGAGAIITPNSHIQSGAVIGAGAVVTGHIPANAVAVGVPAKVIKYRE